MGKRNWRSLFIAIWTLTIPGGPLLAAPISDDFSQGLGDWSPTVILAVNGGASNTSTFQINASNQLELNTTIYGDTEQYAFIRAGAALAVGEEAQVDLSAPPTDTEILITGFAQGGGGQYLISFTGPGNQTFMVKKSSDLKDGFATLVQTDTPVITDNEGNGQAIIAIPVDPSPGGFYRIESSP